MKNGALAYRREFPAQREMCFSPTEKPPQDYTGSHPVPWGRSYASMEKTFLSHRKRRARRQEVGGRKTGQKIQCAAPAIAARCIKHRSALPFRGLHRSPLTASHSLPSVMPKQTKKLRDERHRTALSEFLFTLSIPPGGHSLQLPYRSCSRRS